MKRKIKKILVMAIAVIFATIFNTNGITMAEKNNDIKNEKIINIEPFKELEAYNFNQISTFPIEKTLTAEEMLDKMLEGGIITEAEYNLRKNNYINKKISKSNLESHLTTKSSSTMVMYQTFTMDPYVFKKYDFWGGLLTYKLTPRFVVGLEYSGLHTPDRIVSIESPHIYTGDGENCIFTGSITYTLESGRQFFYIVYGNVYKTATVTRSGGIKIGVGSVGEVHYNVSHSDSFLKNVSFDGRYYTPVLSQ